MNTEFYEDLLDARYSTIPVGTDVSYNEPNCPYDRCLRFIEMPRPQLGDIWDISCEVHATNDDLRSRSSGLYLATEILVGPTTGNTRHLGTAVLLKACDAVGAYNIGAEAHHGLISRRAIIKWTQDKITQVAAYENIFIKFMVWSGSTAALAGDICDITENKGHLTCLVHKQ